MTQRIHKVLLDAGTNHFAHVLSPAGAVLDPNTAARAANPAWPPYTEVCLDSFALLEQGDALDGLPAMLVARANMQCSCAGHCDHPEDHTIGAAVAMAKVPSVRRPVTGAPQTQHGPGRGYVEGEMSRADLRAIKTAAVRAAGGSLRKPDGTTVTLPGDSTERAALGKWATDEAAKFFLSGAEIASALDGRLSGPAALVLAGSSAPADDYYWVCAYLHLWRHLIGEVHQVLAVRWPALPAMTETRLGARHTGAIGGPNAGAN